MKCPKCDYLGFETGDRCKNCGYDFSLTSSPAAEPPLPLFTLPPEDDDEPLIKLPVAPRAPLAVRKTPETPRLRAVTRPVRRADAEPVLAFADEGAPEIDLPLRDAPPAAAPAPSPAPGRRAVVAGPSSPVARLGAAAIDHLILVAIDAAVVYFTLRMAALTPAEWHLLPPAPLVTFLLLVKFAYFSAFTAVGGQTIGKMALHIRVVADDGIVDPARAVRRTLAGVLSSVALGLGFVPALVGGDRRALHDRVAHTRVVALRSV